MGLSELLLPLKELKYTILVIIGFMKAHFSLQNYLESASKRNIKLHKVLRTVTVNFII
jgi:hypothetical protein